MKNKKIYILIIVLISIIVFTIILNNINKSYRPELSDSEKVILAEKAYINYAWGFQYNGMAIFNDGSIYEWDVFGEKGYYNDTPEEHKKWILENGSIVNKKVTEDDLEKIEKNIVSLEDNIKIKYIAMDAGSNYIVVWNSNNEKITLRESGDGLGENNTDSSQKIISIISKYLK